MEHTYAKHPSEEKHPSAQVRSSNRYCSVPQCSSRGTENISFHKFPADGDLSKKWAIALRIGKKTTSGMSVCGKHFKEIDFFPSRGLPDCRRRIKAGIVPSKNIPQRSSDRKTPSPIKRQREARNIRAGKLDLGNCSSANSEEVDQSMEEMDVTEEKMEQTAEEMEQAVENICESELNDLLSSLERPDSRDIGVQVTEMVFKQKKVTIAEFLTTENYLNTFTGVRSFDLLDVIVKTVEKRRGSVKKETELCIKERVLLTLIKLKLNLSFSCISVLFKVSNATAQRYFSMMIEEMSEVLTKLIKIPTHQEISKNIPKCFEQFKDVRLVLDCTEIVVERSKCLNCNIKTYSQYKGRHTIKILIGVTPSGMICFLSKARGGRTSDKEIFLSSGLLEYLVPGVDALMVDKGFLIEKECNERNVKLIRPPFLRGKKQLSQEESLQAVDIASARVHVERSIQRMKIFSILKSPLSYSQLSYIDSILNVIAALVNLSPPILALDKY